MTPNTSGDLSAKLLFILLLLLLSTAVACSGGKVSVSTTTPALSQRDTDKKTVPFVWNEEKACTACHVLEGRSMTRESMLAFRHAGAGENCLTCHDAADLKDTHKGFAEQSVARIQTKKYPQAFCFKCHGSYEKLIELTKDSKVCTDKKGNVANPHDSHLGVSDCFNCHRIHRMSAGVNHCYSCHHANVFECGTCHPIPASKH
ncbi:MAG: cytochrome c3 family protein [Pseudomonadota bacterium]